MGKTVQRAHCAMGLDSNQLPLAAQLPFADISNFSLDLWPFFSTKSAFNSLSVLGQKQLRTTCSVVVITCSKKVPERVQAAAEYSPIISKHSTQINLSSPKKAEIRNGPKDIQFYHPENSSVLNTILEITYLIV